MPHTDVPAIRTQIDDLERQLTEALQLFAQIEEGLNRELKGATAKQREEIYARRTAYEQTLGIEALLDRIAALHADAGC